MFIPVRLCDNLFLITPLICLFLEHWKLVLNIKLFYICLQGVKIYDISTRQRITNVLRDNASLRPDMYPCSLCWKDSTTLVIGWGTSVKVALNKVKLSIPFDAYVLVNPLSASFRCYSLILRSFHSLENHSGKTFTMTEYGCHFVVMWLFGFLMMVVDDGYCLQLSAQLYFMIL